MPVIARALKADCPFLAYFALRHKYRVRKKAAGWWPAA